MSDSSAQCDPLPPALLAQIAGRAGEERMEWYALSPAARWAAAGALWANFLALGGSLDPDPDPERFGYPARLRGPVMHAPALLLSALLAAAPLSAQQPPAQRPPARPLVEDVIPTSAGDLTITFVGHGTLMLRHGGKVIHVDPVGREADYSRMPRADLILITHEHGDHLDTAAVEMLRKDGTEVVVSPSCEGRVQRATVMRNGEAREVAGFRVEAVPAYNLVHTRAGGQPYHPRGNGNGYVISFADVRVYVAGDTENTPEMKALRNVAVAFLPMNLPYTMTPEMVADAARSIRPRILYPYHFGQTDPQVLVRLLAGEEGIEVRVRQMP